MYGFALVLTILLFLGGALFPLVVVRSARRAWPWAALSLASLALMALAGLRFYAWYASVELGAQELVVDWLLLGAAALACVGGFIAARSYLAALQSGETASAEAERLRRMIESDPGLRLVKDRHLVYRYGSPAFARLLGRDGATLEGKTDLDFFSPEQAAAFRQQDEQVLQSGTSQASLEELRGADGPRWMRITRTPILDAQGQAAGILVCGEDITALRQAETTLAELRQASAGLQVRIRLERLVAAIATRFILLPPERVDEGIGRALQSLGKFAGVERCYLALIPREQAAIPATNLFFYGAESGPPAFEPPPQAEAEWQWLVERLSRLETVHLARLSDLPADLEDTARLSGRGVGSFTALPLILNRALIGFFALESQHPSPAWPAEMLELLKIAAEMFVNLLERKWSAQDAGESLSQAQDQIQLLERRSQENSLVTEMGDLLQACRIPEEAYPIIARYLQRLVPGVSGSLYMIHNAKDPAENAVSWGSPADEPPERELLPSECWALRRGRLHAVRDITTDPLCGHVREPLPAAYLCVPLIAQGVAVGVLHLRAAPGMHGAAPLLSEEQQSLAERVAEFIALALSNLNLRDSLRIQAIRDPLTGLFNRRYMEETLEREVRRAGRHKTAVGVIMFDVDKLKPINDRFGHDAGDLMLKGLGSELLRMFRGEDVACRYGGDEFTIVLPEASLADVWRRAEQLREAIKRMELSYEGTKLGPVTLSIGVAAYPDHGQTGERVLLACDAAAYAAKAEGGDRIMMGRVEEG